MWVFRFSNIYFCFLYKFHFIFNPYVQSKCVFSGLIENIASCYQLAAFLKFYPWLSLPLWEIYWIEWSCLIFFWWKIKLGLSVLVFLFFFFSLSRGWTGTCFIKDTSSAVILGGIVFVKTTSSSCVLVFLVLFCLFACSSSFSSFILFLNFFCLQLRYTFCVLGSYLSVWFVSASKISSIFMSLLWFTVPISSYMFHNKRFNLSRGC